MTPWLAALLLSGACAEAPVDPEGEVPVDPGQVPPIPFDLAASASQGAITLTWSVTSTAGVTAYRVYRASEGVDFTSLGTPPSPTYRDDNVSPGINYSYEVASIRAGLEGTRSSAIFARLNDPEIASPDVNPDFGIPSTIFEYTCVYSHVDGVAPVSISVIVDGIQVYPMLQVGTGVDWVGGEPFHATANLPPGGHNFYVTAQASDGSSSRNPSVGFVLGGPVVSE